MGLSEHARKGLAMRFDATNCRPVSLIKCRSAAICYEQTPWSLASIRGLLLIRAVYGSGGFAHYYTPDGGFCYLGFGPKPQTQTVFTLKPT